MSERKKTARTVYT